MQSSTTPPSTMTSVIYIIELTASKKHYRHHGRRLHDREVALNCLMKWPLSVFILDYLATAASHKQISTCTWDFPSLIRQ